MKNYITPPAKVNIYPEKLIVLTQKMKTLMDSTQDASVFIKDLFSLLKEVFPLDFIMITHTSGHPESDDYYFYPEQKGNSKILYMTPEHLEIIVRSNTPTLIRICDQNDNLIMSSFLRSAFPGMNFSALFMRHLISHDFLIGFSLLSRKSNAYSEHHVDYLFHISEIIKNYFGLLYTKIKRSSTVTESAKTKFLPVMDMPGMSEIQDMIINVSRQDCPVLLLGETGTGKEVVANAIYNGSPRRYEPFVKMNCGSIADSLVDSELFGHERGAFTGAVEMVKGRFERANRGFLLLDEIAELPLSAQTRLLRVLQENVIERVGGSAEIPVDVRIIAATHRDLETMISQEKFRQDLYYRLNVFPIYIPPLREHPEDIPLLANFLLKQKCIRQGLPEVPAISKADMASLVAYHWPGNIRELQNVVERSVIMWAVNTGKKFSVSIGKPNKPGLSGHLEPRRGSSGGSQELCSFDDAVVLHIKKALAACKGKISGPGSASELLQLNPNTLKSKIRKYKITL